MAETERDLDSLEVTNNPGEQRFEARVDGQVAVVEYQRMGDTIAYVHTGVPEALRGRGIADGLARAALEYARDERLEVLPLCPFVAGYIERHPEFRSLVVAG